MPLIRPTLTLGLYGSSLTQGRLNGDWPVRLHDQIRQYPECKGPLKIINQGKGSQNSDWGLANVGLLAAERCSHILTEGFSINDAALTDGVNPQVTIANHNANVTAMVAAWRAARANVDITLQTMNPVSTAGAALRPNLAAYYARDVILAGTLATGLLDNYGGVAGGPAGGWPKPLPGELTNGSAPFATPITGGFNDEDVNAFWDPAFKLGSVALSADLLTASGSGTVLGSEAIAAPTHIEMVVTAFQAGWHPFFGVATRAHNLNTPPGSAATGLSIGMDGVVSCNGANLGNAGFGPLAQGDVLGLEIDPAGHSIYFLKGIARSAPFDLSGIAAGALYPAAYVEGPLQTTGKFTTEGDGLHPLWAGAIDTYLFPNVVAWLRTKMAAYWP